MRRIIAILTTLFLTMFAANSAFAGYVEICQKDGLTYKLNVKSIRRVDTGSIIADFKISSIHPIALKTLEEKSLFPESTTSLFDVKATYRDDILFNEFIVSVIFRANTWKVSEIIAYRKDGGNVTAVADYQYTISDYRCMYLDVFEDMNMESKRIREITEEYLHQQRR